MSIAKISKFTDSIVVNGENTIEVQIDWEDLDSETANWENELYCELGNQSLYQYLRKDTKPKTVSFTIPIDFLSEIPDSPIGTGKIMLRHLNMGNFETKESIKHFAV